MLTQPAYNERKWGEYPELRQVLENERIHDMTLISTDDTGLERCRRLIEIGMIFTQNEEKIVNYVKNNQLGLMILKYDKRNETCDFNNEFTRFCRGLVIEMESRRIVSGKQSI